MRSLTLSQWRDLRMGVGHVMIYEPQQQHEQESFESVGAG